MLYTDTRNTTHRSRLIRVHTDKQYIDNLYNILNI